VLKAAFCGRHCNQVEMIAHQALGQNLHTMFLALPLQPSQGELPILVGDKDIFPAVATLGAVMGHVGKDRSRESWHTR